MGKHIFTSPGDAEWVIEDLIFRRGGGVERKSAGVDREGAGVAKKVRKGRHAKKIPAGVEVAAGVCETIQIL